METSYRAGKTVLGKGCGVEKAKRKAVFKAFLKAVTVLCLCWGVVSLWAGSWSSGVELTQSRQFKQPENVLLLAIKVST